MRSSILELQRTAGNRAVTGLLQRKVGWSDASKKGNAWNADEHTVGKVRRIPLEGLAEGLDAKVSGASGRKLPELSSEGATGKAIVLVPAELDATGSIEVLVFLHGHTEGLHRPYAGWRELVEPKPAGPLRQGIDAKDTAPVRDVALDQAEQQLEESGQSQLVIVLPQGGLYSEFSKTGTKASTLTATSRRSSRGFRARSYGATRRARRSTPRPRSGASRWPGTAAPAPRSRT